MAEYIEREAICYQLEKQESIDGQPRAIRRARRIVADCPAADVVPVVRGRWINAYPEIEPNPMFMYGICSVCGFEQSVSDKLKYCPNCGARMDLVTDYQVKDGDGNV